MSQASHAPKTTAQRLLDVVERVGNRVPHAVLIFLTLIAVVMALSHILYLSGASVSHEDIVPEMRAVEPVTVADAGVYDAEAAVTYQGIDERKAKVETRTESARSLLAPDGIRFIYTRLVPSFMGFSAMGLMIVAMMGVGVAEVGLSLPEHGYHAPNENFRLGPGRRRYRGLRQVLRGRRRPLATGCIADVIVV